MKAIGILLCVFIYLVFLVLMVLFTDHTFPIERDVDPYGFIWAAVAVYTGTSLLFHLNKFYRWFKSNLK